jgi:SHS family sialic acid transporter-like MFS transporter
MAKPAIQPAQWYTLSAAFLGWMLDGVEIGIFPLIARPALQEMLAVQGDQQVGIWMGRMTALFLVGAAGGGAVFGWLGDKVGRVRAMSASILVYSLFTGICYFAREPWQLGLLRFVAALGMGGQWSLGVALVMESWPERHRPWLAGAIGAASNVGIGLIGVVAYFFPVTQASWRWIMLVGAAPALLTFFIRIYVPESVRWEAANLAGVGTPFRDIFKFPQRRLTLIGIALSSVVLIGTWGSVQWIPLWADKLTGGTQASAKALTSVLVAAGAVVGCFGGSLFGHLGRRISYCGICLLSYGLCVWLFLGCSVYGLTFLTLCFFVGAVSGSFYGWLPLYLPELFPTRIRATGQGVSYNFGRLVAAAGALGAGQLVSYYGGSYARMSLSIILIYPLGALLVWLAPETRGKPLPE